MDPGSSGQPTVDGCTRGLVMVGTVMGICQKCFIDTVKILELARHINDVSTQGSVVNASCKIIEAIEEPLHDIPKGSVETTLSRNVVRAMQTDILDNEAVILMQTGGYDDNKWYRLDIPRTMALKLLAELEDEWLYGPDQRHRRMFRQAHKILKRNLGV